MSSASNRVAIVGGVRTPFVKAGTSFRELTFQQLGAHVVKQAVERLKLKPTEIDEFIFGTVLLDPRTPNWAREILFAAGLPKSIYAQAVSNNCISGLVAITSLSERIALGKAAVGLAGGSESMSNPALVFSQPAAKLFFALGRARSLGERLQILLRLRPGYFWPQAPSPTEPSTGLTMGQHMEITAQELGISRQIQDQLAFASHTKAAQATKEGKFNEEIAALNGVTSDTLIRADTSLEKLAKLRPVFDTSDKGTITAGNASALTDGASVVALMSEDRARAEGREILAFVRDSQYGAIDAKDGLLMAPGVVVPRLLKRTGLTIADFDLIEVHEAFGAQVAANLKVWEEGWKEPAIGKLDPSKLNVSGGSIAIGHPFAATGGRIVLSLAHELKRRNAKRGLISICAAGAMAGALILERD